MIHPVLLLASAAFALAGCGLLLWAVSQRAAQREATHRFVASKLADPAGGAPAAPHALPTKRRFSAGAWGGLLLRAGVAPDLRVRVRLVAVPLVLAGFAAALGGPFAAAAVGAMAAGAEYFLLWLRAQRRQRRMVQQLPEFLDAVVRMITIGNSLGSAFQSASSGVEQPLREVLDRVDAQVRSGKELDHALQQVSTQYRLEELYLVAAVVGVALRFGGRSDVVLERMAAFMRDLAQARQELVALSAEVRLSAWILALLPLGIAGFIVTFNNALFMGMWNDPVGFYLLVAAVALQVGGSYWLYRMARSV